MAPTHDKDKVSVVLSGVVFEHTGETLDAESGSAQRVDGEPQQSREQIGLSIAVLFVPGVTRESKCAHAASGVVYVQVAVASGVALTICSRVSSTSVSISLPALRLWLRPAIVCPLPWLNTQVWSGHALMWRACGLGRASSPYPVMALAPTALCVQFHGSTRGLYGRGLM